MLRLWLLVVLAVLLPVRSGMAAAMLCPAAGMGMGMGTTMGGAQLSVSQDAGSRHPADDPSPMTDAPSPCHDAAGAGEPAEVPDDGSLASPGGQHGEHAATPGSDDEPDAPSVPDRCSTCSALCALTPLLATVPGVPQPRDLAATSFPALSAPAIHFVSDGQERPPRSS